MLVRTFSAMKSEHVPGTGAGANSALLRRIARRVSTSGGLNVGEQTPLEPAPQTILERREMFGMTVGRDHELLAGLVEAVEGVEELFEDLFLAIEELDVVEQQHIDGAIPCLELVHPLAANSVDELVEELL